MNSASVGQVLWRVSDPITNHPLLTSMRLLCVTVPTIAASPGARADGPEFGGAVEAHASVPDDMSPAGFPLLWSETNTLNWRIAAASHQAKSSK